MLNLLSVLSVIGDNSVKHRVISFFKSGKVISLLQQCDDNWLMREFHYLLHEV